MKQGQFPAILPLVSLNGQNGFKLDGEAGGDESGYSVSTAGDVNGDGHADLLIGAPYHDNFSGRSYVVFGGPNVGGSGDILLSSLNGTNGFKLDGGAGDESGRSVSASGDINSDGYTDLLIGAPFYSVPGTGSTFMGRSYVVFGGPGVGSGGDILLSNLNGENGFKLDGEAASDSCGWSVSAAGDINGDGYADLVIGAPDHATLSGRSYVVFGGPSAGGSADILLSTLNGVNGFKLDGESSYDRSGTSVSAAGDVNGDGHADLLIGASGHASYAGRSYVVFGGPGMGRGGEVLLSSLNGVNGFKLDGEGRGVSGFSVSTSGDINGDGYADLLIGAIGYTNYAGRSYVVFGGSGVGGSGDILLSNLNGMNGFKLDGEVSDDYSGWSISAAGDINGDGHADLLIGAPDHASNVGRSYVVFGGPRVGGDGDILLSNLDGNNGFKMDGEASNDYSGCSVKAAGDINGDGIDDIIIGAYGHHNNTGRSYVILGDVPPVLVNNSLSLSAGAMITFNSTSLAAYDRNHNNNTLVFVPNGVTHGQFEVNSAPGVALVNFTQQQVADGVIRFVHDGSLVAPDYTMSVYSTGIAWTGPFAANITFNLNTAFTATPTPSPSLSPALTPTSSLSASPTFKVSTTFTALASSPSPSPALTLTPSFSASPTISNLNPTFTPALTPNPTPAHSDSKYATVQKAIIGVVVSGAIAVFFAVLQACLKRSANKKLSQALGQGTDGFDLAVMRPIAKEISQHIKVTGFMHYTTNTEMKHFKGALRKILFELTQRGVNLNFEGMSPTNEEEIVKEIAWQTKRIVLNNKSYCNKHLSFFKAQATPQEIEDSAGLIAEAVAQKLKTKAAIELSALELPKLSVSGHIVKYPKFEPGSAPLARAD